jgi:hypothetical protein
MADNQPFMPFFLAKTHKLYTRSSWFEFNNVKWPEIETASRWGKVANTQHRCWELMIPLICTSRGRTLISTKSWSIYAVYAGIFKWIRGGYITHRMMSSSIVENKSRLTVSAFFVYCTLNRIEPKRRKPAI